MISNHAYNFRPNCTSLIIIILVVIKSDPFDFVTPLGPVTIPNYLKTFYLGVLCQNSFSFSFGGFQTDSIAIFRISRLPFYDIHWMDINKSRHLQSNSNRWAALI